MSGKRLFGTDGIRGPFGRPPLDRPTVTHLGVRLAETLRREVGRRPRLVVGGDTRANTAELASWLMAGFTAAGGGARYAGVLPTPGIAFLTHHLGVDAGVAISASHNPYPDNGIKLFDGAGFKWSQEAERVLEAELGRAADPASGEILVEPTVEESLDEEYFAHLVASLPGKQPLAGLSVALDAANGAAAPYAERLLTELGAKVVATGDRPDGRNINLDRGSTQPRHLIDLVRQSGSMLGIAFDGDADRALLVDESGTLQDGDTMLYLWALDLARRGQLDPATIVATTMSNLGLELALRRQGIEMIRCDVGDRVVVEAMRQHGATLGGEQSGHLIHLGLGSTGDGLLTAVQLAHLVLGRGEPLSKLAAPLERFPQVLVNVRVDRRVAFSELPSVEAKARSIERHLGETGRLLLRYSGTEPLARVMIEGRDQAEIETMARELADEIGELLGDNR